MKLFQRIRAFFTIKGETKEMQLKAAEVRKDGVFLHSIDDEDHFFFVKSKAVDIFINPDEEITEDDILIIDKKEIKKEDLTSNAEEIELEHSATPTLDIPPRELRNTSYKTEKKRFSVLLYSDEYDMLVETIKKNGYKRAEYFMACMTSAKKQSFFSTYKRYTADHAKRYKLELKESERVKKEETAN